MQFRVDPRDVGGVPGKGNRKQFPPTFETFSVPRLLRLFASEMTYIVSDGALNSTHSLTHCFD